VKNDRRGRIK